MSGITDIGNIAQQRIGHQAFMATLSQQRIGSRST
ncbi:hypothetical protein FNL37_0906 [Methylovorus glucosotrophus]|nr:hypothetical protein FNL37_0906 [Methylovorus glucosotrophus]